MNQEFFEALNELIENRGIDRDVLIDTIQQALLTAYKKNFGVSDNVRIDIESGGARVFSQMTVVEDGDLYDNFLEIELSEARKISPNYEIGDVVENEVTPKDFGRIAAQTAKQVVVQRIREAEREITFNEFTDKTDELVVGEISRKSKKDGKETVFVRVGRGEGILLPNEQIPGEEYNIGSTMKFYLMEVKRTSKSPSIMLSRTHTGLIKRLFEAEVPEIREGIIQIKSISREAGSRTKIAVKTTDESIDPIGACVGPAGLRVKNIVDELGDEKIDIIRYSDDPAQFITASLSPSKVVKVILDEDEKSCMVVVPDYQLSLAIGKEGQNARLAARLCGWKIDIKSETTYEQLLEEDVVDDKQTSEQKKEDIIYEDFKLDDEQVTEE